MTINYRIFGTTYHNNNMGVETMHSSTMLPYQRKEIVRVLALFEHTYEQLATMTDPEIFKEWMIMCGGECQNDD